MQGRRAVINIWQLRGWRRKYDALKTELWLVDTDLVIFVVLSLVTISLLFKPLLRPGWSQDIHYSSTVQRLVYNSSVQQYNCSKQSVCATSNGKFMQMPMGVLATWSVHAKPSSQRRCLQIAVKHLPQPLRTNMQSFWTISLQWVYTPCKVSEL